MYHTPWGAKKSGDDHNSEVLWAKTPDTTVRTRIEETCARTL